MKNKWTEEDEKISNLIRRKLLKTVIVSTEEYTKAVLWLESLKQKFNNKPTAGECVTISKERYNELLIYESIALWAINVIIVASLPNIKNEKLKELSNNAKCRAVQAAFQEALKRK